MNPKKQTILTALNYNKIDHDHAAAKQRLANIEQKMKEKNGERFTEEHEIHVAEQRQEERRAAELLGEVPIEDNAPTEVKRKRVAVLDSDLKVLNKAKKDTTELIASLAVAKERARVDCANALLREVEADWEQVLSEHFEKLKASANLNWHLGATPQTNFLRVVSNGFGPGGPRWQMQTGAMLPLPESLTKAAAEEWFKKKLAELIAEAQNEDGAAEEQHDKAEVQKDDDDRTEAADTNDDGEKDDQ